MNYLSILTSAGHFGFRGRIHTERRPSLLMIAGAFPLANQHQEMIDWFPAANVVIGRLPGMHVPWSTADAKELTEGLEEAIEFLFRDGPLVVCAGSTSALVTIPLRSKNIQRKVILEPFFSTEGLWPFLPFVRTRMARYPDDEALRHYLWSTFGYGEKTAENRDYRHLLDSLSVPTDVVVGGMPLQPERPLTQWPSFTSVEDRELLRANRWVNLYEGPPQAGHNLWANPSCVATVRELLKSALHTAGMPL